jgi:hypothetical protein
MAHNIFSVACGMAALFAFIALWLKRRNDLNVMFGGVIFFTLFAGPHALIYEWALLALTGLLWRSEWRDRPNTWFALYLAAWGVLYFSTDVAQMALEREFFKPLCGVNAMVQLSVPVLAVVGLSCVKLLRAEPVQRSTSELRFGTSEVVN